MREGWIVIERGRYRWREREGRIVIEREGEGDG